MEVKNMIDPLVLWQLLRTFVMISLIAIGGMNAVIPAMLHEIVDTMHWMDEETFMHLFTVTQITPGPNVVIVSLLGWQIAGWQGLVVTTFAILLIPCLLAFLVGRVANRLGQSKGFKLAQAALVPVAVGLIVAGGLDLAQAAHKGWLTAALTLVNIAVVFYTKANPIWALSASALTAIAAGYTGLASIS
jgi:chromate transporter